MPITNNLTGRALYFYKNEKLKRDNINLIKCALSNQGVTSEVKLNRKQRRKAVKAKEFEVITC